MRLLGQIGDGLPAPFDFDVGFEVVFVFVEEVVVGSAVGKRQEHSLPKVKLCLPSLVAVVVEQVVNALDGTRDG